ncbi:MAG: metallophosphoesterase [Gemmatimonas sp.]|nr:metallophosphoesterase [Gemmatimonadaceae bacterium]
MRVGVLSDTHDRVPAVAEFARLFREAGVGIVLHAGDYCSPFALSPLLAADLPLAGVFGRNDGDHEGLLAEAAKGMGTEIYDSPHSVDVSGVRLLLIHDLSDVAERSVDAHAVVIHGCSHIKQCRMSGSTLLLNPGEACGWLFGVPTAAVLDLETLKVDFLTLNEAEWKR